MLYSHSHRFIFIHIFKVAGVSVKDALGPYARPSAGQRLLRLGRRLGLIQPDPLTVRAGHVTAAEIRAALPAETFDRCFKFAFVRNPWDWQVSWYHYICQRPDHYLYPAVSRMRDFEEFLTWHAENDRPLQKSFVTDARGELLVDFVGRYERLEEDFQTVCEAIGVRAELPHRNRSSHHDYRRYYTERTRRLVETAWAEDVRFFEYQFDPASGPPAALAAGWPACFAVPPR